MTRVNRPVYACASCGSPTRIPIRASEPPPDRWEALCEECRSQEGVQQWLDRLAAELKLPAEKKRRRVRRKGLWKK